MVSRRHFLSSVIGGGTIAIAGCTESRTSEQTTPSPTNDGNGTETFETPEDVPELDSFVTIEGTDFVLNGSPFRFFGSNNDMLTRAPKWYVDQVFEEAAALGMNALRTRGYGGSCHIGDCEGENFALLRGPGEFSDEAFRRLDYAVYKANQQGVRLVLQLINNYDGPQVSIPQFVEWSKTATERDEFFTDSNCRNLYKEYVETVLTHKNRFTGREYRNDPGIMMWELIGEPDLMDNDGSIDIIQGWIEDVAPYFKSINDNHLLTMGHLGLYDAARQETDERDRLYIGPQGIDFIENQRPEAIDAASFKVQIPNLGIDLEEAKQWIRDHAYDAHEILEKPVYCGEYSPTGFGRYTVDRRQSDWKDQDKRRAREYHELHETFLQADVGGLLQWSFMIPFDHETDAVTDPNDWNAPKSFYPEDPHTYKEMASIASTFIRRSNRDQTTEP